VSEIQRGRSVAASRGVAAVLCHSDDGATCSGDAGPDWADGWILFQDTDGDNTLDAGETVSVSRGMDGVTMPSSRTSFRFAPGFQLSGFGGTVGVCIEKSNASARWIALSNLGRPRLKDAFEAGDPDCVTAGP
ncbi:MAG TPA: GspH/FimT family protein, partial [Gammaproteobacteria bacterium]